MYVCLLKLLDKFFVSVKFSDFCFYLVNGKLRHGQGQYFGINQIHSRE